MRNRSNLYYIDKTKHLEEGISRFPSIYIEGNAACGKTTVVEMLLRKYPEIEAHTFDLKYEEKDCEVLLGKIEDLRKRIANETLWIVIENIFGKIDEDIAKLLVELILAIRNDSCVFFVSREKPQKEFLDLLWKQKMTLLTMEKLLFTEEEIRTLTEQRGTTLDAKQILGKTGGWPGCVSLLLHLSEKGHGIDELLDGYEMRDYVKNEMLSCLKEEEVSFLQRAVGCPWVSKKLAEEVWEIVNVEEMLENLQRKGILLHDRERGYWKIAPLFLRYMVPQLSASGKETAWYEKEGYIAEALACLEQSGTEAEYRACVLKYYEITNTPC